MLRDASFDSLPSDLQGRVLPLRSQVEGELSAAFPPYRPRGYSSKLLTFRLGLRNAVANARKMISGSLRINFVLVALFPSCLTLECRNVYIYSIFFLYAASHPPLTLMSRSTAPKHEVALIAANFPTLFIPGRVAQREP